MAALKIGVRPPKAAIEYARKGLAARQEATKSRKCCTGSVLARARSIISGDHQDAVTVRAWFRRHAKSFEQASARALQRGETLRQSAPYSKAIQAWWIWGGDPMRRAAEAAVRRSRKTNPSVALPVTTVTEDGVRFETGVPVEFDFVRNRQPSQFFGSEYQQDIEPAGRFMLFRGHYAAKTPPSGWEYGHVAFESPLVLPLNTDPDAPIYNATSWKAMLFQAYGKTGRALSQALLRDGYDVIVTVGLDARGRPVDTREIVDLRVARRKNNPVGLLVTALGGAVAGSMITYATIGGSGDNILIFEEVEDYEGSVLMMMRTGFVGHVVDDLTGCDGWSHCALDLGWIDEKGHPVYVESIARHGVRVSRIDTESREIHRIPLTVAETNYARGAAQAFLGNKTPYRARRGGLNCAEFVVACLPRSWRKNVPKTPSPNDLVRAWSMKR